MGIYISGMEMPKSCAGCDFCADGWCYVISADQEQPGELSSEKRPDWCPLVEVKPHGRLIDADALWEKEKSERALKEHCHKGQSIIFDAGFLAGYRAACQIASKMPIIIPADREEPT